MAGGAGGTSPVSFGTVIAVGLQNNARAGEYLVVWDIQVYASPAGTKTSINTINCGIMGGRTGAFFGTQPTAPLVSQTPSLPGIIWVDNPGFAIPAPLFFSNSLPTIGYQWPHDWPFCAIAPGDSLVVYTDANASDFFGVNFMYEVVPGGIP
jgi:hypothetical protein